MDLGLTDKRILITGASRGIGLAIAEGFLGENARVALLARSPEPLKKAKQQLAQIQGADRVLTFCADATNLDDWQHVLNKVETEWGGVDVVVANVGDGRSVPDALPNAAHFSQVWRTNFESAELTSRATLPLLEASGGCLLFISSIAGLEAIGAPTDYSVAKTAVVALAKQLGRKLAPSVRVNCIAPGNIYFPGGSWDEKMKVDSQKIDQLIQSTVPMRRFGTPQEIADATLFLCSERARFITGAVLRVDGGQTVGMF
jgi:3-oxoacyl-[acyl-carrier protein] reductase